MRTVRIAVAMKTAVAASERGEPRPMPQTPCPLVHPAPRRVPNPTRRPATIRIPSGIGQRSDKQATKKSRAPAGLMANRIDEPTENAADPGDAPVQHQEQRSGQSDQRTADQGRGWREILHETLQRVTTGAALGRARRAFRPACGCGPACRTGCREWRRAARSGDRRCDTRASGFRGDT